MNSSYRMTSEGQTKMVPSASVTVWRGINCLMSVFFLLAAFVNLNDADWYIWAIAIASQAYLVYVCVRPIYVIPGVLSLAVTVKPNISDTAAWSLSSLLFFVFCLIYAVYQVVILFRAISGKLENPLQHEEGREMGGLIIIITWTGISRFTDLGRPGKNISNKSLMTILLTMMVTLTLIPLLMWSVCYVGDWHKRLGHCNNMFVNQKKVAEL